MQCKIMELYKIRPHYMCQVRLSSVLYVQIIEPNYIIRFLHNFDTILFI